MNYIVSNLENQVEISVYMNDDFMRSDITEIKTKLKDIDNVKNVEFISREDLFEQLKEELNVQNEEINVNNPLSDSFQITVKDINHIDSTVNQIQEIENIDNIHYGKEIIQRMFEINKLIHFISYSFIIILIFATIFIIANISRVSVHARKTEIEIMRYIGAKDSLIYFPFIVEGLMLGFIGGFASTILFRIGYTILINKFSELVPFINLLPVFPFLTYVSISAILFGMFLSSIGCFLSVKKYIKI